jgi:hypothetical protein
MLVADEHDVDFAIMGEGVRRLDGDLRADSVGITDRQRDRLSGSRAQSGSASSVSMRELSQTTIRSSSWAWFSTIL